VKLRRMWWLGLLALAVAVPVTVAGSAGALTTVHVNPGSLNCTPSNEADLNPGPGEEQFLFILTSPVGNPTLTVVTSAGTQTGITGTQQGNGSIHYVVTVDQGVTITDAFVEGQNDNSTLTISHCELGPPVTTTTTAPPTTTTKPTTTTAPAATTTTAKPAAPAAVVAQPKLTG
jgi:hypothetical protein